MSDIKTNLLSVGQQVKRGLAAVGEFSLSQGLGQAAGMLSGLIYVRWMPIEQYAIYALSLNVLSLISVGSDLGVNGSLNHFWRRSILESRPFGPKLAAVRMLRMLLFLAATVIGGVVLFTSTRTQSVPLATTLLCFGLIGVTAFLQIHIGLDLQVMRLEGRQRQSYYCETIGNLVRLGAAAAVLATGLGAAWFSLTGALASAIAMVGATFHFRGRVARAHYSVDSNDWRYVAAYLLPVAPSVIVYLIQDPLIYWLTATRSGPTAVAEVFALGRIGALWSTIGTFTYVVLLPRLSWLTDDAHFLKVSAASFMTMCALAIAAIMATWLAPEIPLLLIGGQYSHLKSELLLATASASVVVLSSFLILTARVRGWVKLDPLFAMWQLIVIVSLCFAWRFDSAWMVLELNLIIGASNLTCAGIVFALGLWRPRLVATMGVET